MNERLSLTLVLNVTLVKLSKNLTLNPRWYDYLSFNTHFGGHFSTRSDWTLLMKLLGVVGAPLEQSLA